MLKLRTRKQSLERYERQLAVYMNLYHKTARNEGELARKTVYYANLCNLAAKRIKRFDTA